MKAKKRFCLFIALAIMQLAVLLYMGWHWEDILQTGQRYTWNTAPVDPYDALRGRYVDLHFKEGQASLLPNVNLKSGETAYAIIGEDEKGYAFVSGITDLRPAGNSYIKITIRYINGENIGFFTLPFKRYYMQESLAPGAEVAFRKNAGKDSTVSVRIKDGYGVVEELYIGDKTIYEYLQEE